MLLKFDGRLDTLWKEILHKHTQKNWHSQIYVKRNEGHEKRKTVNKNPFDGQREFEIPGLLASMLHPSAMALRPPEPTSIRGHFGFNVQTAKQPC